MDQMLPREPSLAHIAETMRFQGKLREISDAVLLIGNDKPIRISVGGVLAPVGPWGMLEIRRLVLLDLQQQQKQVEEELMWRGAL